MKLLPSQLKSSIANTSKKGEVLFFSSVLHPRYYSDLEALMFFNPQQSKVRNAVSQLVERYGNPKIVEENGKLRFQIGSPSRSQTLFCFDRQDEGELIGAVVYLRERKEHLAIVHLAVKADYSFTGCYRDRQLVLHLIQKVCSVGARIKGVEYIEILYERSLKKIPVR
jgi:hypothetical protein